MGIPDGLIDLLLYGNPFGKNISIDIEQFVFIAEDNRWYLTSYGHMDIRAGLTHHADLRSQ